MTSDSWSQSWQGSEVEKRQWEKKGGLILLKRLVAVALFAIPMVYYLIYKTGVYSGMTTWVVIGRASCLSKHELLELLLIKRHVTSDYSADDAFPGHWGHCSYLVIQALGSVRMQMCR